MSVRTCAVLILSVLPIWAAVHADATESGSAQAAADGMLIVHCLLPGQVRQLGTRTTYVSPRRGARITAAECEARGGEYVRENGTDPTRALSIWLPEAREGDPEAQINVAMIFERGLGMAADFEEAARWYRRAAESGSVRAQLKLSQLYETGRGVPLNLDEAVRWYRLAMGESGESASIVVDSLTERNAELMQALESAQAQLALLRREREELSARLAAEAEQPAQSEQIEALQTQLEDRQADIERLQSQVINLEASTRSTAALEAQAQEFAAFSPPSLTLIEPRLTTTRGLVKVHAPAPGSVARVVGRVSAGAGIYSLTVDGRPVTVNPAGMFMSDLEQAVGRSISIVAVDRAGQVAEITFDYSSRPQANRATAEASTAAALPFGRYKALVIGNNRYTALPPLQTAESDAAGVAEVLRSRYGFEVMLLKSATRFEILSALNGLRETLTSEDNLIVYYAGHGELDQVNMRGYWLPVDADRNNTTNWISNVSITDILNAMSAKHVLVLADSCYSGALTRSALTSLAAGRTEEEETNWIRTMLTKRSRQALTSGGLQPVLDSGGGTHSIFAGALISVLENNEQILEGRDLFEAVAARVAYRSSSLQFEQVPEFAPIRHAGHEAGAFFLRPDPDK